MTGRIVRALLVLYVAVPVSAATFTVSTNADSGPGSLRQAMLDANANPGADTIDFAIGTGPQTIALLSELPAIDGSVIIDATTQPGFAGNPIIELNGAAATGAEGFRITFDAPDVTIRGFAINRFFGSGIYSQAPNTRIETNWIGLGLDGGVRPNGHFGVNCVGPCTGLVVGGVHAGAGNVISGTYGYAVRVFATNNATIVGNRIGTDPTGLLAIGNYGFGVMVDGAHHVSIVDNVIASNVRGVNIFYSHDVTVTANLIGVGSNGVDALPNGDGIYIEGIPTPNSGDNDIVANTIANNVQRGIAIFGASSGNLISRNRIFDNGALGIDLIGTTANDPLDADTGPNDLQNHPVPVSAANATGILTIGGTLHSTPGSNFLIEFFGNDSCTDAEGAVYLGETIANTDVTGNAAFVPVLPAFATHVTATAINQLTRSTSEFSACVAATGVPVSTISFASATYTIDEDTGMVSLAVNRTGDTSGPATVQYRTSDGTATAGADYSATSGTLAWIAGDAAPKTIVIPILNDAAIEPDETFTVSLSNPTGGAILAAPTTVTVTITSEDAPAAAEAIPTASEWALLVLAASLGLLALRRL